MSGTISFVALLFVGIACAYVVFSSKYNDNIFERLGFSAIGVWSLARLPVKLNTAYTEPIHLLLHLGLLSLLIGFILHMHHWHELDKK